MRVLRALLCYVMVGLCGSVLFAVSVLYEFQRARLSFVGYADGVRSYIGYERDVVAADVHAFVKVLSHEHCFGRGHSEFI